MNNPEALKEALRNAGAKARVMTIAELLNVTRITASGKLNGKVPFKDYEIKILAERFGWDAETVYSLFLK